MTKTVLERFYDAFTAGDAAAMTSCYDEQVVFKDPAFGTLKGERARHMWHMLLSKKGAAPTVRYTVLHETDSQGTVEWIAFYNYGVKQRPVINKVTATFVLLDGKILQHTDHFNLWNWSKQALGIPGYLLGWSDFFRSKIQKKTNLMLDQYTARL